MKTHDARAMTVTSTTLHHHVRLGDLAAYLDPETTVNVVRNTEVATDGPRMVPYDEVVLELTDDDVARQLLEGGTIPRSRWTPPRLVYEEVLQAIEELRREIAVRERVFPKWVEQRRITATEAARRLSRMRMALAVLEAVLPLAEGAQNDLFTEAA